MKQALTIFAISFALLHGDGLAADYPERPLTLVCWSNPGSPNDQLARNIAKVGAKYFGHPITVLTKLGGTGALAMGYLLKQRKDGYTLSTTTSSQLISMASGRIPFEPSQFTYIIRVAAEPFLIAVPAASPFVDLKEFFDYAKKNPGGLSVSGFGAVSAHFLAFSQLADRAGVRDIRWIPYDGGADAALASLGEHTDAVHANYAAVSELVRAGKMKVLGVSSETRLTALPDVPTYREQGFDISPTQWRGIMGPAGLPEDVSKKIRELMEKTVTDPEFVEFLRNANLEPAVLEGPDTLPTWVAGEVDSYRTLLRKLNLAGGAKD